ncbi:MAG TPA: tRNA (adenosine(37)-N6)-threonylcarbamoyltransferase complex transferase subunit TsaD [Bacillota bacterium]|nr:tRNA (adenosine(37)-N6)-threonylcarbamoyltransferase complex transferase subunit TsaD [Bacillota bacterium]
MTYFEKMKQKTELLKEKKDILILAIETSCDETAVALVKNGREVLSNTIASQIDIHKEYGGVVPEIASRKHVEAINHIVAKALTASNKSLADIDAIAVTYGPGLVGALLVGLSVAKALAFGLSVPLIGVHHIEGHISSNYIQSPLLTPPFLCLVVSGGHTMLVHVNDYCEYELMGQTLDDAAGEAFDKIARVIGLGYPGGPAIQEVAKSGDPNKYSYPRVNIKDKPYDFSFSGLKTAVINHVHKLKQAGEEISQESVAASFQQAVIDVLTDKAIRCALALGTDKLALAGGVAANTLLKSQMKNMSSQHGIKLYYPSTVLSTDNAAMIASAGYFRLLRGDIKDLSLNAIPYLSLKGIS